MEWKGISHTAQAMISHIWSPPVIWCGIQWDIWWDSWWDSWAPNFETTPSCMVASLPTRVWRYLRCQILRQPPFSVRFCVPKWKGLTAASMFPYELPWTKQRVNCLGTEVRPINPPLLLDCWTCATFQKMECHANSLRWTGVTEMDVVQITLRGKRKHWWVQRPKFLKYIIHILEILCYPLLPSLVLPSFVPFGLST